MFFFNVVLGSAKYVHPLGKMRWSRRKMLTWHENGKFNDTVVAPMDWSCAPKLMRLDFLISSNFYYWIWPQISPEGKLPPSEECDRKWESDEQSYSTWRWVHAVSPVGGAGRRNGWRGERIIQCSEEAKPNQTCHTSITDNDKAQTESAEFFSFFGGVKFLSYFKKIGVANEYLIKNLLLNRDIFLT